MKYKFDNFNETEKELLKEALSYYYIVCIDNVTLCDQWIDKAMNERKAEKAKELYIRICENQFHK